MRLRVRLAGGRGRRLACRGLLLGNDNHSYLRSQVRLCGVGEPAVIRGSRKPWKRRFRLGSVWMRAICICIC